VTRLGLRQTSVRIARRTASAAGTTAHTVSDTAIAIVVPAMLVREG
jgi:hypothetical protein